MLRSVYFWILAGAFGLFFGMSNPLFHVPFAVLLYPASLYMLAKISNNPFRDGTLSGLIGASFSMYWISIAVYFYGDFPWIFAIPCAMVMGAYIGLWGGLFSFVMGKMLSINPFLRALAAALFWYICEWIRSFLFTGFSWLTLSSAFAPIPEFIQSASIIGAFALSGVFAGIGVLLAESFTNHIFSKELQASYTKNIIYKGSLSFGGVLLMTFLFIYGNVRLENSSNSKGNAFLYGTDTELPYINFEEIVVGPAGTRHSVSFIAENDQGKKIIANGYGSQKNNVKKSNLNKSDRVVNTKKNVDKNNTQELTSSPYQEYHKNPQKIGPSKNGFVLPNFSENLFNKDTVFIQVNNDIFVPEEFFKQDNIVLFTMVQGNVSQAVKWEKSFQLATVQKYIRLSEQGLDFVEKTFPFVDFQIDSSVLAKSRTSKTPAFRPSSSIPSVLLWPETSLPFFFQQSSSLSSMVEYFAKENKIIFGAPGIDFDVDTQEMKNLYNRLFFLQDGELSHYDKEHLVPFGEYIPELPFFADAFNSLLQGLGGFSPGVNNNLLMLTTGEKSKKDNSKTRIYHENMGELGMTEVQSSKNKGKNRKNRVNDNGLIAEKVQKVDESHPLSSLICYEAIFPQIAQEDVKNGAQLLINVSNDAWYNKTSAAEQHLYLSLMRAVEQKRFLVRAGNTGISAFIDDYGRIMARSDLFTDETLSGFVALRTEKTMYHRMASYLPFLALFVFLMLFIYAKVWALYFQKEKFLH